DLAPATPPDDNTQPEVLNDRPKPPRHIQPPASILNKSGPAQLFGNQQKRNTAPPPRNSAMASAPVNTPADNRPEPETAGDALSDTASLPPEDVSPSRGQSPSTFELVPQKGHTRYVTAVDYARDGNFLVTCALDGTVRLWDTRNGIMIRVFDAPTTALRSVRFFDSDKKIVTVDDSGHITVFATATGELIHTSRLGYFSWATSIHPLKDGQHVIVSHKNEQVYKVNVLTGKSSLLFSPCTDKSKVRVNASVSPDETKMAVVCNDGEAKLYDLNSQQLIKRFQLPVKDEHRVVFLNDSKRVLLVLSAGFAYVNKNALHIWDTRQNKLSSSLHLAKDIRSVDVSRDGRLLALNINVNVSDAEVEIRDLDTWKRVAYIDKLVSGDVFVRFSPDSKKIVAPGDLSSFGIFDIESKNRIRQLSTEDSGGIERIAVNSADWKIATESGDGNVYLWNMSMASLERTFDAHVEYITSMAYSPDGKYISTTALTNPNETIKSSYTSNHFWDARTGREIASKIYQKESNRVSGFSPSGRYAVISGRHEVYIKDTESMATVSTIKHKNSVVRSVSFNDDETNVLLYTDYEKDAIYDVKTGKALREITLDRAHYGYYLSPNQLLLITDFGTIHIWDARQDKQIAVLANRDVNPDNQVLGNLILNQSKTKAIGFLKRDEIGIWELPSGRVIKRIKRPDENEVSVNFLPHENFIVTGDKYGALKMINLSTMQHISLIANGSEWIAYTDDGYFDASKDGGRLVAIVDGNSSYRIDQMAIKNNRPDLVFSKIGLGSPELIDHYRSLYQQRLRKMGIEEDALDSAFDTAPVVEIVSSQKNGDAAVIKFEISERILPLSRYNIYVNDVPLFGATGKPAGGRNRIFTETVQLTNGENKIEIGAINRSGIESLRPNIVVPHKKQTRGSLYYLGFGISNYQSSQLSLKYAAKDALDLETLFKSTKQKYNHVYSKVFTDAQVTPGAIKEAKGFFRDATVDDTAVLFVAGHGLYVTGKDHTYYYLTHNTDLARIEKTAAPFELLEDLLQGIAPRKKLFLLDTCQSGEEAGAVAQQTFSAAQSRGLISRGIRRKVLDNFGIPKDQYLYANRNRFIYNDIFRSSGAIVLSSSRGFELSYESDDLKNGLFTEQVLNALSSARADTDRDRQISTRELQVFVSQEVSSATLGLQNPVVDRDNLEIKFGFPLAKKIRDFK
ncbi:MAG: PQQ-binding-like beta-propeller repeat protein, partial [Deltaproteobacteria bacterium]|nr:PQQ-binding-like beta-propeller repeat protein [Deltaproteobacteria bacterium]